MKTSFSRGAAIVLAVAVILTACGDDEDPGKRAGVLLDRGLEAHVAGKTNDAVKLYNEVLALDPRNKFAYYNLGQIEHVVNKDVVAAENNYRLALNIDPNYTPALFNLALIRANAGDVTGAEQLYRKVVALTPSDASAHLNLGLLLKRSGRSKEGDALIAKAVGLDPKLADRLKPSPTATASPSPAATAS